MNELKELYCGLGCILIYFAVCAISAICLRVFTKIGDEPFRKLLHYILLGSLLVWVNVYEHWWIACASCIGMIVYVYPLVTLMEKSKDFSGFMNERRTGEIKSSLIQVFGMFSVVILICWGVCEDKMLVLASIYAWGFGDAAAALIGKRFGKHKLPLKSISKKSWEGTIAMFLTSFITVWIILSVRGGIELPLLFGITAVTALVSTLSELFTKDGFDTVTCPIVSMVTILVLLNIFGGWR